MTSSSQSAYFWPRKIWVKILQCVYIEIKILRRCMPIWTTAKIAKCISDFSHSYKKTLSRSSTERLFVGSSYDDSNRCLGLVATTGQGAHAGGVAGQHNQLSPSQPCKLLAGLQHGDDEMRCEKQQLQIFSVNCGPTSLKRCLEGTCDHGIVVLITHRISLFYHTRESMRQTIRCRAAFCVGSICQDYGIYSSQ